MAQRRGAIDVDMGHAMSPAFITPGGRAAGHEDASVRRLRACNRIGQFSVLERGSAQSGDLVQRAHVVRTRLARQAVLAVGGNCIELIAKNVKRKALEARLFGCVDEGADLVVNRHGDSAVPSCGQANVQSSANDGIWQRRYSIPRCILLIRGGVVWMWWGASAGITGHQ